MIHGNYVLLSGSNGFLGTQIALKLISCDLKIIALVRSRTNQDAETRLKRAWWEFPELLEALKNNQVEVISGNVEKNHLGMDETVYQDLALKTNYIIHAAADLRLNAPLDELRKVNVQGTINMLEMAKNCKKDAFKRFSHVSTAYVAGKCEGEVLEDDLSDRCGFSSNYEQSKYEAEKEVIKSGIPYSIFRPGMIVGDSRTGAIKNFNTIYVPLRLYFNGKLKLIPVSPLNKINMVPVDYVSKTIVDLSLKKKAEKLTFHLTAPDESLPSIRELVDFTRQWANEKWNIHLPAPLFLGLPMGAVKKFFDIAGYFLKNQKGFQISVLSHLTPYIKENRRFSRRNTDLLSGPYSLSWKDFMGPLLNYAIYAGFFHRSDRTVHEQIMHRLKSKTFPVTLYDVVNGEFECKNGITIRNKIIKAVQALKYLGITPGDRVALVGYNSTRYLILDVALGLSGVITVPIYYTSPLIEIEEMIKDSGSRILFIGTPDLLKESSKLDLGIPLISFTRDSNSELIKEDIIPWEKFMEMGNHDKKDINAPVDFESAATIRYTSGTTGTPRGVQFNHGNLRWMGEFIASMPPWEDRIKEVSYLSFLPMNHVVEGILGTYSPYYAPAPLKLYFMEEFHDLSQALPLINPTIFFSVPRFYEKLWTNLEENWLGRLYLRIDESLLKSILRRILRRSLLKKSGLKNCAQLIVGSAPVSEKLLYDYRKLGIEIHNAYGLTEAPLITINRWGDNNLETVGKPLPFTKIKIAKDGEIMVKGPQTTSGYFNNDSKFLFQEDWLLTGDYGYLNSDESLVITGRKKEVLINAYGKTINPLKIETRLKSLSGIDEALLIGDSRAYCVALLWSDEFLKPPAQLDDEINELNSNLANPEKVKKWVVLKNDLSIEAGDLTANLKLKRNNIMQRFEKTIEYLYHAEESDNKSQDILHMGIANKEF